MSLLCNLGYRVPAINSGAEYSTHRNLLRSGRSTRSLGGAWSRRAPLHRSTIWHIVDGSCGVTGIFLYELKPIGITLLWDLNMKISR